MGHSNMITLRLRCIFSGAMPIPSAASEDEPRMPHSHQVLVRNRLETTDDASIRCEGRLASVDLSQRIELR